MHGRTLLLASLAAILPGIAAAATLRIAIHGVRNDHGHIRIGVCREREFLSETCYRSAIVAAHPGEVDALVHDVAPGRYGIAVYQDEDNSGRLKRNFLGMPREDLGFSGNPGLRFGPPSFSASAIVVGNEDRLVDIDLHHFGS